MGFENVKVPTLKPKTVVGRLIERTDLFGYNAVRDSVIPFFAFAKAHEEELSIENLELAFANVLKKFFADPDPKGTIRWTIAELERIPKAFDFLKRQYDIVHLPPSIIHTLNLMRRANTIRMDEIEFRSQMGFVTKDDEPTPTVILESEYGILINEIQEWVKKAG